MTRIVRLNERFLSGARLDFRELTSLLVAYGFVLDRVAGSHHTYVRRDVREIQVVQPDGKDAKPYQVRQLLLKIRRHGLMLDDAG